jgi:hypothetical protein
VIRKDGVPGRVRFSYGGREIFFEDVRAMGILRDLQNRSPQMTKERCNKAIRRSFCWQLNLYLVQVMACFPLIHEILKDLQAKGNAPLLVFG